MEERRSDRVRKEDEDEDEGDDGEMVGSGRRGEEIGWFATGFDGGYAEFRNWGWRQARAGSKPKRHPLLNFVEDERRRRRRRRSLRLEAFLASSRSMRNHASNQSMHQSKPCMGAPPFFPERTFGELLLLLRSALCVCVCSSNASPISQAPSIG